jgi:glycosyltransferase involved in cell wall biosynthesis
LHIITSKKRNVSVQRNLGAKNASGKYVIFLDADSHISASFISSIKRAIRLNKGLVFVPYIIPQEKSTSANMLFKLTNLFVEVSQSVGKPFSTGGSMIFEKTFFEIIGGFDETLFLAEDHAIIQKAQKWGVKAKCIPSIRIKSSLRRMKREGSLNLLYKYALATAHLYLKGDIKSKIFEYQMGGKDSRIIQSLSIPLDQKIKKSFKDILKQLS